MRWGKKRLRGGAMVALGLIGAVLAGATGLSSAVWGDEGAKAPITPAATAAAAAPEAIAHFGPVIPAPDGQDPAHFTIRGTTDIAAFKGVLAAFSTLRPALLIRYEQWGSNDLFAQSMSDCQAGLAQGTPAGADMVISSGVHQMVRLVNDGCALAYQSDATAALPPDLVWRDEIWGVTREPAVMVYNRDVLASDQIARSRFDLLDLLRPEDSILRGKVATYDIEASGLGYLFAFSDAQEATSFGALLESFARSGAVATCCSAELIDGVATGQYLIAYNVLGSYALERAKEDPRIGVIVPQDYALVLARAAVIPKHAIAKPQARAFLDFILSPQGVDVLTQSNLIVPLADDVGNPAAGTGLTATPETLVRPIPLGPVLLVALDQHKRANFIRRWREAFDQ